MHTKNSSRLTGRLFASVSSMAIAAVALTASPASAEQAAAQSGGIETVVVTAQFTEQNLQTAPLAITAVTGDELHDRGINDLSQLGSQVPGLTLNKTPAAFGSGVQTYIRGVGQYDTAFAAEPGVGMYIDDVYYGTLFGSSLELYDLARVEVLRGPQGVIGGKNNIGGSIKLVSQKPQGGNTGYLEVGYGTRNEMTMRGTADLTVIPDRFFIRVSAMSREQDGYVDVIDYACKFPAGTGPTDSGGGDGVHRQLPVTTTRHDCSLGTNGGTDVRGARIAARLIITSHMEDTMSADIMHDDSESQADTLMVMDRFGTTDLNAPVYVNRGGHVRAVSREKYYGRNSDGNLIAVGSPPPWPTLFNLFNMAHFGIPWDQRFMANPFKTTYGTYTSQIACDATANPGCSPNSQQRYTDGARVHSWGFNNVFDWDITDNVHFRNITGWRIYHAANSNDTDLSPMSFQLTSSYPNNREFQEEGRFTGTLFDDHLDWTLGGFYYHRLNTTTGGVDIDAIPLRFQQHDRYVTNNKSVYAHAVFHWGQFDLFGGARYTKEDKTYYFNHILPIPGAGGGFFRDTKDPACEFVLNDTTCPWHEALVPHVSTTARPDWRAGADWHVSDDAMLYVQYSTGYRTGGTNSRPFDAFQLTSYGPETLKSYEIGAKTDWWDHRLRVNLSIYKSNYEDTITPVAEIDPIGQAFVHYYNLGSSTRKGFELEVTAAPIDNLLIDASYSLVRTDASPAPGAPHGWLNGCTVEAAADGICPLASPGTLRANAHAILFPERTAHVGIQYIFEMPNWGTLVPRLDINYQSEIFQSANDNPYTKIDARTLADARITWNAPDGGWQASLLVNNIADKQYFYDVFDLTAFNFGSVEAQPAPGREWLFTIRKSF